MIEVSCSIDEAALGRLERLLNGIAEAAPQKLASETRHAAIYICQSLRARTKSAPKRIPRREYEAKPYVSYIVIPGTSSLFEYYLNSCV